MQDEHAGAPVMLLGEPLALGFWWGLFTESIIPITLVIVSRLLDEEKFLAKNGRQKITSTAAAKLSGPLLSLLSQNADLHTRLREPIWIKS
jgi:hypothetical protein